MAELNEQQQKEQDDYLNKIKAMQDQKLYEVQLAAGYSVSQGYTNGSGGATQAPSTPQNYGPAIKVFGPVSLDSNYCQIPTVPTTYYPDTILLPTGDRGTVQGVPYQYRESAGAKGLVQYTGDHYKFVNSWQNTLDPKLIYYMEKLYFILAPKLGVNQIIVTSGFRSPQYQRQIGGVANSPHCAGWAIDISANEGERFIVADAAYSIGFGGIAIGNGFTHIDIGPYGRWDYGGLGFKYISPSQHKG
ncbi:MAG TPA: D-Ala-D-Ala carboxypeptidase family metallohydrolase [Pseudoneobacillus sp.]|jgi:uncharacterized protein YcbK (DUF882 family)|nr:D-Ala-D-Ala carboxypeptidase family metallohydrolase [Pseudoneobacillus sp.]